MSELTPYLQSRSDFEVLEGKTYQELTQLLLDVEDQVRFAEGFLSDDVDPTLLTLIRGDAARIRAEMARRRQDGGVYETQKNGTAQVAHNTAPLGHWPELNSSRQHWPALTPLSLSTIDRTNWIIDKMLPQGTASLLVAKPKVGKSCLAVQASLAVARGLPFL